MSCFEIHPFWNEENLGLNTFYKRWLNSTYAVDKKDHTGRVICVVDLASQLFRLAQAIGELAWGMLKGFGSLTLLICALPVTAIGCCVKSAYTQEWKALNLKIFKTMHDGLTESPCSFLLFLKGVLPQLGLKAIGNMIGIAFPEVGRFARNAELLKTPIVSFELLAEE